MFGLVDVVTVAFSRNAQKHSQVKRLFVKQPGPLTWVCFLPWRTDLQTAQKHHLLPRSGNLVVYEVPDNLLAATPDLTLDSFDQIRQDFESFMTKEKLADKQLAFLGLSAGSMPAFYFANRYPCQTLVAVCPTRRLGEGIFSALAARSIKREAIAKGFTAESYDRRINQINIENNLDHLPGDITIYLARFDKFVPFSGGKKLVARLQKSGKNIRVRQYNFFGHLLTMHFFGKEIRKVS